MNLLEHKIMDAANKAYPDDEEKRAAFIEGARWLLYNQWINTEEGIPEEYKDVLVSAYGKTCIEHTCPIYDNYGNKIGRGFSCYESDDNVYWTYIPVLDK